MSHDPIATGRRIGAALALAGVSAAEIAPELNISGRTLMRTIAGTRQAREWEYGRLAELTGVPEWFLREGFAGQQADGDEDRLAAIEAGLLALDRKLDLLDVNGRLAGIESELRNLRLALERSER